MKAPVGTVLLVDDDPATLARFRHVLEQEPALRVATAASGVEGLARAREIHPDLIVSDYHMPEMNGFELCRRVKGDPDLDGCLFMVLSGATDPGLKIRGLNLGVDHYLTKPIEVSELIATVRASLRLKRLTDRLRSDKGEVDRLHQELGRSFDQLLQLLIHLVDLGLPGSAGRGARAAELARRIAERFEVPPELVPDLELAARLHQLGPAFDPGRPATDRAPPAQRGGGMSANPLAAVERLRGAAELLAGMHENWDGTGFPGRFVSGQIPLRSRILRVSVDFLRLVEDGKLAPGSAIEAMRRHQGTWYDPFTLTSLEAVVLGGTGRAGHEEGGVTRGRMGTRRGRS